MLDKALEYLNQGYSIIPLQPKYKIPYPGFKWAEFNDRKPTIKEVRQWWKMYPEANIAIITGKISGIVAVDIDIKSGGDFNEVYEMSPTELISQTGTGGYHLIYTYPKNGLPIKNKVTPGVDLRADRGYIVAPPSLHENGKEYRWIRTGEMTEFNIYHFPMFHTSQTNDPSNNKWVSDLLRGVDGGSRNASCAKLAGYYAGKAIPKDICMILMQEWNKQNDPPMSTYEVTQTVDSVYRTVKSLGFQKSIPEASPDLSKDFDLLGLENYMVKYGTASINWDIDEWLPSETIAFMVSPPGTYKTWLLLDLAVSIAGGVPFLGHYPVNNQGSVVIVQQEDFHGQLAERVATIINSRFKMIDENGNVTLPPKLPIYFHTERRLKFNDPIVMAEFEEKMYKLKPKLVIIDPLYSATTTDDYMSKTAETMFPLKRMRDNIGCTFLLAHHTKKGMEGNQREGLWGSQFLNAFLETGWQIRKTDNPATITMLRHFKVRGAMEQLKIDFDINTEYPFHYNVKVGNDSDEPSADILAVLNEHGKLTITDLAQKTGIHRSTISRRLKLMEKDKIIIKEGNYYCTLESVSVF